MKFATARDILGSSKYRKSLTIEGINKPIEIIGLTQSSVMALTEISKNGSAISINAWLIKQCVPAFRWWSLSKINRRIPVPVIADLVKEIMAFSGLGAKAVEDAGKKSESAPGNSSS